MATPDQTDPDTGEVDLNELRSELQIDATQTVRPATDDLINAVFTEDNPTEALVLYYLRAAEFGAIAQNRLENAGEIDLPEAHWKLVTHAREALYYSAKLASVEEADALTPLGKDLNTLVQQYKEIVEATEILQTDIEDSIPDAHPDDTRWKKFTSDTTASFRCHPIGDLDLDAMAPDGVAKIELYPVREESVSIGIRFEGEKDGHEVSAGVLAGLSPDQAESLAAALCECAEEARQAADEEGGDDC